MGCLKNVATGQRVTLTARTLVGRAAGCAVVLSHPRASGEHAVVLWDGERWCVRDLGSTNGTRLDSRRLTIGERATLTVGAALRFAEQELWELVDDAAPATRARCRATGVVRVATDGLLALPDEASPEVTIFEDRDGQWMVEELGAVRPACDQESVAVCGQRWTLEVCASNERSVATTQQSTGDPRVVGAMTLRFEVSRDREHVALSLVRGDAALALGGRAHHEMMLLLARARTRDRDAGEVVSERGWLYVDDVLDALKVDLQHFNVAVFRARQLLARMGVLDAGSLFERRATTRQIRLGTDDIEIIEPPTR